MRTHPIVICLIAVALCFIAAFPAAAERASEEEALRVCRNWLAYTVHYAGDWAGSETPEIADAQPLVAGELTLATCFSIEPRGFIVVPALKDLPPVKAHSETSNLDASQMQGFAQLLRDVLRHRTELFITTYGSMEAAPPERGERLLDPRHRADWDRFAADPVDFAAELRRAPADSRTVVGPLMTTVWHQGAPYNNFCPMGDGDRCVVGCVATAAAQIMRYHEWPPDGGIGDHTYYWDGDQSCGGSTEGAYLYANFEDPYDWAHMVDDCEAECSSEEEDAMAELCYEVGVSVEMNYGACGSGASYPDEALKTYFAYDPTIERGYRGSHSTAEWFEFIQEEIDAGRPIWYAFDYSETSGHAVVCDGWKDEGGNDMYHINYGWGGPFNAWYTIDNIYHSIDPMSERTVHRIMPPDGPYPCCIGEECFEMTWTDCRAADGIWMAAEDMWCYPTTCIGVIDYRACCIGPDCQILSEDDCLAAGGEWRPNTEECGPYTCNPQSACCVGETCETLSEQECADAGGMWLEDTPCWPSNPCLVTRYACCQEELCQLLSATECADLGGVWIEGTETCDPSPCGSDLSGGLLIVHAPPGLEWTSGQDWCQRYKDEFAMANGDDQVSRIDPDIANEEISVWYVIMGWEDSKEVCGLEFGLGNYDPGIFGFLEWGACTNGGMETPMTGWPGPNRGTALLPDEAWQGSCVAAYWFAGYAYEEGVIPLAVHPTSTEARFTNCAFPSQSWEAGCLASLGILTAGEPCYEGEGPERACCVGATCTLMTYAACETAGGSWLQLTTTCDPNPCQTSDVAESDATIGTMLMAPAPNPFTASATLRYHMARPGQLTVEIFDVGGRMIRHLASERVTAGWGTLAWDGTDDRRARVSAGTYLCRLSADGRVVTQRMIRVE